MGVTFDGRNSSNWCTCSIQTKNYWKIASLFISEHVCWCCCCYVAIDDDEYFWHCCRNYALGSTSTRTKQIWKKIFWIYFTKWASAHSLDCVFHCKIQRRILKNFKQPSLLHFITNCLCIVRVWMNLFHKLATFFSFSNVEYRTDFKNICAQIFLNAHWVNYCLLVIRLRDWRQHYSFFSSLSPPQNVQICHVQWICNKHKMIFIFFHSFFFLTRLFH